MKTIFKWAEILPAFDQSEEKYIDRSNQIVNDWIGALIEVMAESKTNYNAVDAIVKSMAESAEANQDWVITAFETIMHNAWEQIERLQDENGEIDLAEKRSEIIYFTQENLKPLIDTASEIVRKALIEDPDREFDSIGTQYIDIITEDKLAANENDAAVILWFAMLRFHVFTEQLENHK